MSRIDIARMIRVDQAGEFGATRIYAGQLAVMGDRGPDSAEIVEMARQEEDHRARSMLIARRGVRPTALSRCGRWPVSLGAATALMGPRAAMACTAAIETEIDRHYTEQLEELGDAGTGTVRRDPRIPRRRARPPRCRAGSGRGKDPGLSVAVQRDPSGCRAAIKLSERI
jgi:ubiquinone biosynthesis monooxygenase Coq7